MITEDEFSCSDDALEDEEHEDDGLPDDYRQQFFLYRNCDQLNMQSNFTKQKSRRRKWTQRDMTNAYNAVKNQGMSLRGAATAFNVPESTLRDRVHGRVSLECSRPGPPTFFTFEEEKKMVDHILFMSKIGYPYTRNQVVELAGDMTKAVGRIAPFKYLNPSQAWFYAFLNRWPDLKNFLFGPRSNRKSKGVSGDAIQSYFEQLEKVLTKYNIKDKADHVWIVDEVSISCENQPPRILPIGIQRAQSVSYWNPTVAMIGAANAAGEKVPPFLIYRGDSITTNMMEGAVRGTKFANSPSGWVNSDAFIQWFLKHFRLVVTKRPLVLLYDGHLQFVSVRVLERAREDGVLLFPLPPHPAYNHCVENTCFLSFQLYFDKRQERFFQKYPNQPLIKLNISPVLTHAYERALNRPNMTALFEKLGICPFNNLSTSIGAYLNVPDDYDLMNSEMEDGIIDRNDSMHQWAGNGLTMSTTPNLHSQLQNHTIENQHHSILPELLQKSVTPRIASQLTFLPASTVISKNGNHLITLKKECTLSSRSTSPANYASYKVGLQSDSRFTQQLPMPSKSGISGRTFSIKFQGPGANRIRPLGKSPTLSFIQENSNSITFAKPINSQPQMFSNQVNIKQFGQNENKNTVESMDFSSSTSTSIVSSELASSPATLNCYLSESDLSPSVNQASNCHLIQQMVFGESGRLDGNLLDTVNTVEVVDNIEEGEAPGVCVVCGQLEPPELAFQHYSNNSEDCQVVDWAHCDYCNRWVHLNGHCSLEALIENNTFMCVLCRYGPTGKHSELIESTEEIENISVPVTSTM